MNAGTQPEFDRAAILKLVRGLAPVDAVQLRLTASISPSQRVLAGISAQAFARAIVRGALERRHPQWSWQELNMQVLRHFTPVHMERR